MQSALGAPQAQAPQAQAPQAQTPPTNTDIPAVQSASNLATPMKVKPKYSGPLRLEMDATVRPTLVMIGGAKCGSTDAWNYLTERYEFGIGTDPDSPRRDKVKEMWCLSKEDHKTVFQCYKKLLSAVPKGMFTMDATPAYLHLYSRHAQTMGNCETAALNMAYAARDSSLLAMLRDPVKRSRSEYSWTKDANGGFFRSQVAPSFNQQLDVELEYLFQGAQRGLLDLLLQKPDDVTIYRIVGAYRQLSDGYNMWLADHPEWCRKVSQKPITTVSGNIRWCLTWPTLIPSLYYPLLLQWRSLVFRPRRAAILQSEAYYADRRIIEELFPMNPKGQSARGVPSNKQMYHGDSEISPQNARRLKQFFELPNRRLRELLRMLPNEGVAVVPPADRPGAWWPDA